MVGRNQIRIFFLFFLFFTKSVGRFDDESVAAQENTHRHLQGDQC